MASKKIERVANTRPLTQEEAAKARRLRELAENDKDEIIALGRKLLAEKRKREAAARGAAISR